jgi:hypothetical protein
MVGSEREREKERARACVSSLSLFDARNRGEMIQTESPSFFNASVRVVYDMCFVKMRTLRRKKKMEKKKLAHQITCETLSFLSLSSKLRGFIFLTARAREKREERESDVFFWSDDASAKEKDGPERLVGYDCEQRRCLFQIHFAEIESNRREVFV